MPAVTPPPPRVAALTYASRAAFGLGFVVLGAIALYRVVAAPAPLNAKLIGGALGASMIALGAVRIGQYLRWRRRVPPAA